MLVLSNNGVVFLTAELEREAELLSDHFIRWLIYAGMFATGTEGWSEVAMHFRLTSASADFDSGKPIKNDQITSSFRCF